MYLKKIVFIICRVSFLVIFLFISMKSGFLALNSSYSNNDDVVEIAGRKSCGLNDNSCCCGPSHNNQDCCCNPKEVVSGTSKNKFFNTFIASVKCLHVPGDFLSGSLSDFQSSSLITSLHLFDDMGFQIFFQENLVVKPHLCLPFKPPKKRLIA